MASPSISDGNVQDCEDLLVVGPPRRDPARITTSAIESIVATSRACELLRSACRERLSTLATIDGSQRSPHVGFPPCPFAPLGAESSPLAIVAIDPLDPALLAGVDLAASSRQSNSTAFTAVAPGGQSSASSPLAFKACAAPVAGACDDHPWLRKLLRFKIQPQT